MALLFSRCLGLLFVLLAFLSRSDGFAPAAGSSLRVTLKSGVPTSTTLNVGATFDPPMLEDKPHLMIGGRGYYSSNLFIDQAEYDDAKEAAARRLRQRIMKFVAGYTALICGSVYLRQVLSMLMYIPYYYKAYPLMAAMATCGFKSMVADFISQMKSWNGSFNVRRSLSGLTYGATILGVGSKLAYTQVLPRICPPGIAGTALQCGLDNFVLAPLIWIPGAYAVKALFFRYPLKKAMGNYINDIKEQGLLNNYWKLWVPAQLLNFSIMPQHLRVPFVAAVGFLWFLILTNMTYKK